MILANVVELIIVQEINVKPYVQKSVMMKCELNLEEIFKMKITKQELFMKFAPEFNFEYNADQLLELALKRGFVTKIKDSDLYLINEEY
jgi:hypothetical protein